MVKLISNLVNTRQTQTGLAFVIVIIFLPILLASSLLQAQSGNAVNNLSRKIAGINIDLFETSCIFTKVAEEVIPAVVSISSTKRISSGQIWENNIVDKELQEFFGEKYFNLFPPKEFMQKGSGSGIIVNKNGYILTNLHVIENAELIQVTLVNNHSYQAKVIGADPLTELAIIKIDETSLPVAQLGNSDSVKIGQWVLAIGNPLELTSTVTAGIVSAIGREIDIIDDNFGVENFIQTDATINPGNSGGALVNLAGEVIGINTAIATQSGYSQGYGFAIPINLAKKVIKDLIKYGYVIRSYLGISMQDVNEKIARALNLSEPRGVFIDYVSEDSPAWTAGLREKDVLINIDDLEVNKGNIVQSYIAQKKPGEKVLLTIIRNGRELKLKVVLGKRVGPKVNQPLPKTHDSFQNFGLKVQNISRRVAEELELKVGEGVIVVEIEHGSPAYEANININDIILKINDEKITSVFLFNKMLSKIKKGKVYIFKIKRQGNIFHRFVEIN